MAIYRKSETLERTHPKCDCPGLSHLDSCEHFQPSPDSPDNIGRRVVMLPGSWFQNRQRELGNMRPYRIEAEDGMNVHLVGINADGSESKFRFITSIEAVR